MNYAVVIGSGAMIFILSFIKIGSGFQKLLPGIHRQEGDHISLLRKVGKKNENSLIPEAGLCHVTTMFM
jgi:hypothetical protein